MKCYRLKFIIVILHFYLLNSFAQNQDLDSTNLISVQYENEPLREVLRELSRKSKIKFVYDDDLVENKTISCSYNVRSIEKSLSFILANKNISYKIIENRLVVLYDEKSFQNTALKAETNKQYLSKLTPKIGFQPTPFTLPTLLEEKEPDYPKRARDKGLEGIVEMNLLISTEGKVKIAELKKSSGHKILDNSSIAFAKTLKFNPAKAGKKPIELWVTRNVVYKIVKTLYFPSEYVKKIQELMKQADQLTEEKKNKVTREILNTHDEIARYRSAGTNSFDYNKHIKEIVKPKTYTKWKDFWGNFPLRFVIFSDFILRYPDSEQISEATELLLNLIKEDIMYVKDQTKKKQIVQQEADLYLKKVYSYLGENYPHVLTIDLESDNN